MGKPKQAKLASKDKSKIIRHNGMVVQLINMSNVVRECAKCRTVFGRQQFVVQYKDKYYCRFACSDVED